MWLRFSIAFIFLCTLVSTASISSRDDVSEEEVEPKSNIPLVVSIPSKVLRANKFNENDIRSPVTSGRPKPPASVPLAAPTATRQIAAKPTEPVHKIATEPVVSSTTAQTSPAIVDGDDDQHEASRHDDGDSAKDVAEKKDDVNDDDDGLKAAVAAPEETPRDTKELVKDTDGPSKENEPSDHSDNDEKKNPEDSGEAAETTVTLATTASSSGKSGGDAATTADPSSAPKNVSAATSDEVVERDYGLSLGAQQEEEEVDGEHTAVSDGVDSKDTSASPKGQEEAVVLDGEVTAEEHGNADGTVEHSESDHAQDRIDSDVAAAERVDVDVAETDADDEVDPFDEAAQASEVDYAVVAPLEVTVGGSRDLSAVHQQDGGEVGPEQLGSDALQLAEAKPTTSRKASTVPKEKEALKKSLGKTLDETKAKTEVTETPFVVLLDGEATATGALNLTVAKEPSAPTADKKDFGKQKTSGKKLVQSNTEDQNKDLEPAESSHDAPSVLSIDGGEEDTHVGEVSALTDDLRSSVVDSAADVGHDSTLNGDESEYEYIYEYIDLNSTDLPENLPEGSVIIGEDGQLVSQTPIAEVKTATEEDIAAAAISPALPDNGTQELEGTDGARPPSFRTFGPPVAINTADLSLIEGPAVNVTAPLPVVSVTPLGPALSDQPTIGLSSLPGVIPSLTTPEFAATARPDHAPIPFIAGVPESPVYFVGIQREKLPGALVASPGTPLSKDAVAISDSNVLEDGKQEKVLGGKGDRHQLNALYALSRALPLDDNLPFLVTDADDNATVVLPPNLPDPFSEELLGDVQSTVPLLPSTPTLPLTPLSSPISPLSSPSTSAAAETPSSEATEAPLPETTSAATEATAAVTTTTAAATAAAAAETGEEKSVTKPRGSRPGFRRRVTTTTTSTEAPSTEDETTTAAAASPPPRRGQRPVRVGGRRKTTTEKTTTTTASEATAEAESTEKPAERSRFGNRGRGRLTTRAGTTTTESDAAAASDKDKDSNTIANGNKRPGPGRRVPLRTTTTTTTSPSPTTTNGEKDSTTRSAVRGRRPQFRRINEKASEEKTTAATSTTAASDGSTPADETTTTRKQLFRPRGRGRFSKKPAAADDDAASEEDTHSAAESSASELKEASPVPTAADPTTPVEAEESATEAAPTEASGPPRKFPPRFRPGARARIPHRSTESANAESEN